MMTDTQKIKLSGFVANCFEWYDYTLFGFLASTLSIVFFPHTNKAKALILTLFVFALSYFVRPIGGLFFGWLADKKSLTSAYRLSLLCMAVPAFIIALLPVSLLDPAFTLFIFIVLRLVQGIAVGGEFPLLALYLNRATSQKQVFNTAFTVASAVSGLMLGTFVVAILHRVFDAQAMLTYGWRIGFMIAALLAVVIYFIQRYALLEVEAPRIVVPEIRNGINKEKIINIMALFLFVGFTELAFYAGFVWFPVCLQHFHLLSAGDAFFNNAVSLLLMIILTLVFAYKVKPQNVFAIIRVGIVLTIIMFVILLKTMVHEPHILLLLTLLLALVFSLIQSVLYFIVCQLTKIFSGQSKVLAFTFSISVALLGSTAPAVCTMLIRHFSNSGVAIYVAAVGVLTIIVSLFVRIDNSTTG